MSFATLYLAVALLILFCGIAVGKRTGAGSVESGLTIVGVAMTITGLVIWLGSFIVTYCDGAPA